MERLGETVLGWSQRAAGAALGKVLAGFYKSVEKLGFVAGGEFKAAVTEGRKIDAKILLGDRNVDITLARLASALSKTDRTRFETFSNKLMELEGSMGIDSDAVLARGTKQDVATLVEGLKQRQLIREVMANLKTDLPEIYSAMIGERDVFMADAISNCLLEQRQGKSLVGVVGAAHLEGIENNLQKRGFRLLSRNCSPSS